MTTAYYLDLDLNLNLNLDPGHYLYWPAQISSRIVVPYYHRCFAFVVGVELLRPLDCRQEAVPAVLYRFQDFDFGEKTMSLGG